MTIKEMEEKSGISRTNIRFYEGEGLIHPQRRENGYQYCDECPDYPCADVMEKENRYTSQYPHRESPLENLRMIREKGMDAFLEQERQQWTCPKCDRPFSVHDRNCPHCGQRIEKK